MNCWFGFLSSLIGASGQNVCRLLLLARLKVGLRIGLVVRGVEWLS